MKRLFGLALAGLLLLSVFSAPVVAGRDIVKVMTRNQYLGADLSLLIQPPPGVDPIDAARAVLVQIAANNFLLRAQRLATEVALTRPDLIGLQEVIDFKLDGQNVGPPFIDHLDETIDALADKGQSYVVAAKVENLNITIPISGIGSVRVLDRDVILAREGVEFTEIVGLCGVPVPNPAYPLLGPTELMSTPSKDGCNYTIVAEVPSPLDPDEMITIERGFVGVDATVRGKTIRFVNTHLEGMQPDPNNPASAIIQSLQSVELVGTLQAITPPDRTIILLGDFNSSPEDEPTDLIISPYPTYQIIPPYQIIVHEDVGFADVWDTNLFKFFDPNGFTCCQDKDLLNTWSLLDERIDIIFFRGPSFLPLAFVTGRVPIFPLFLPPNWASDHGGVFGKLIFR
jgi:endonuclease/exonuclease/phosphatase family metal-dependent hydrolase